MSDVPDHDTLEETPAESAGRRTPFRLLLSPAEHRQLTVDASGFSSKAAYVRAVLFSRRTRPHTRSAVPIEEVIALGDQLLRYLDQGRTDLAIEHTRTVLHSLAIRKR